MMSEPHASDTPTAAEPHGTSGQGSGDPGEGQGHDDHGHAEPSLGPIDWPAWAVGVVGVLLGLAVAWCFFLADLGLRVA
jgi:hypothetical protein